LVFFHKIKSKLRTKDTKVLLENFISLFSLKVIGMLLPLITLPYVLRTIGFEKYGIIVFSASLVAYFQALTDFSFMITAVRDVSIFRDSPKKLNIIYSKVIIVKSIFLLLSLLIIAIIVVSVPTFLEYKSIYFWSSLMLVGYALFPEWFFQGIEKMRYITYLNLGIKLFFTLCIFIFIRKEEDFWIYPLLQSCGLIGAGIVGQIILMRKYQLKFIFLPFKLIKQTIRKNFSIFINQFVPTLYNNTSTFLLGLIGTKEMVGIYQAILTMVNLSISIVEIFSRVFFPFLNRKKDAFNAYKKLMLSLVIGMCLVLIASHKLVFWYLNVNYKHALLILIILCIGLIGYALSNIYGLNYFIIHRKDKLVMKNTIIASLIGFLLAYPLIFHWSIIGAAINLSLSRCLMGGGLFIKYKKLKIK